MPTRHALKVPSPMSAPTMQVFIRDIRMRDKFGCSRGACERILVRLAWRSWPSSILESRTLISHNAYYVNSKLQRQA